MLAHAVSSGKKVFDSGIVFSDQAETSQNYNERYRVSSGQMAREAASSGMLPAITALRRIFLE
jgi:hypothetical protein